MEVAWGGLEPTQTEDTDPSDGSIDGPVLVDQQAGSGEIVALFSYNRAANRTANFCLTDNIMLVDGVKTPTASSLTRCLPLSLSVETMADVQVEIIAPPVIPAQQQQLTMEFQVHNRQPESNAGTDFSSPLPGLDATGLRLEATLSGAGVFQSFAMEPAANCDDSDTARDCSLDDLAPGETLTLRQTIEIEAPAGNSLELSVEVWSDTPDPRLPNLQVLEIPIGPNADIVVTQEADENTACELLCPDAGPCPPPGRQAPQCSVRSALELAANTPGEQSILLGDGVFELDRNSGAGSWTVNGDLQLLGLGAGRSRLSGAGIDSVLRLGDDVRVALEDLSIVDGNTDGIGGGIEMNGDGELILRRVHLQGNSAEGGGGGIFNRRGRLELWDSTVSGNESIDNYGGGIFTGGPTRVVNSTLSGNSARLQGGGMLVDTFGSLSLESSTITANTLTPSQFNAVPRGSGLWVRAENPSTFYQSVISGNGSPGDGIRDCAVLDDNIESLGYNYIEGDCLDALGPGDQTGEAPLLSGLGDQKGPTPTHIPLAGSPLIDAGDPACSGTDQRGIPRPQEGDGKGDARCDIGAVEFQLPMIFRDSFERVR